MILKKKRWKIERLSISMARWRRDSERYRKWRQLSKTFPTTKIYKNDNGNYKCTWRTNQTENKFQDKHRDKKSQQKTEKKNPHPINATLWVAYINENVFDSNGWFGNWLFTMNFQHWMEWKMYFLRLKFKAKTFSVLLIVCFPFTQKKTGSQISICCVKYKIK